MRRRHVLPAVAHHNSHQFARSVCDSSSPCLLKVNWQVCRRVGGRSCFRWTDGGDLSAAYRSCCEGINQSVAHLKAHPFFLFLWRRGQVNVWSLFWFKPDPGATHLNLESGPECLSVSHKGVNINHPSTFICFQARGWRPQRHPSVLQTATSCTPSVWWSAPD